MIEGLRNLVAAHDITAQNLADSPSGLIHAG